MVEDGNAAVCDTAVLGAQRLHKMARVAESAQGVLAIFPVIKIDSLLENIKLY